MILLWKPALKNHPPIKRYEVFLLDDNGNSQPIILHKKKLLLFRPKESKTYNISLKGIDGNGNTIMQSTFIASEK